MFRRFLGEKIKFRLSKLEIFIQGDRQRRHFRERLRVRTHLHAVDPRQRDGFVEGERAIFIAEKFRIEPVRVAHELGAEVIKHERNRGYGATLLSLFTRAKELGVDIVVTIDGDGQHDSSSISRLIEPILLDQADLVIGSRFEKTSQSETPTLRRMGIRAINYFTRAASGRNFSDTQCGMRAYRTRILPVIFPSETGMGASTEILIRATKAGLRVKEVSVPISQRNHSTQNPIFQGFDVIGSTIKQVSIKSPLRFYGVPSTLLLINGIFFGIWAVDSYIATKMLVVNLTVISLASIIMGLILGTTAVILYSITSIVRDQMLQQSRR